MIRYDVVLRIIREVKAEIEDLEVFHLDAADFLEKSAHTVLQDAGIFCTLSSGELAIIQQELLSLAEQAQTAEMVALYAR